MSSKTFVKYVMAGLFCSFACMAEGPEPAELDDPQAPGLDEPEADQFRASYSCAGGEEIYEFTSDLALVKEFGEDVDPFYCLTRCEGHDDMSRARKTAVDDPSERTDSWCLSYAANFCSRVNRELESWCWGMREEDDD